MLARQNSTIILKNIAKKTDMIMRCMWKDNIQRLTSVIQAGRCFVISRFKRCFMSITSDQIHQGTKLEIRFPKP